MASLPATPAIVFLLALSLFLVISPALSLTCTSQKFSNKKTFANCSDLPQLNAFLHYTIDASNSSLAIAFVAPPPKPGGWVGYAINPSATGMVGGQALVAFKDPKGTLGVKMYNLTSYGFINETKKLSFDVWDLSTEDDKGNFIIFATLKLQKGWEKINQIWQVGAEVKDGVPLKHAIETPNLTSKDTLQLTAAAAAPSKSDEKNGDAGVMKRNLGFLFLVSLLFIVF